MELGAIGPKWQRNAEIVAKLDIIFTILTAFIVTIYTVIGAICYFLELPYLTFGYTSVVAIPAIVACTVISLWGAVKLKPATENYEKDPDDSFTKSAVWQNANVIIFILVLVVILLLILLVKDYTILHYVGIGIPMLIKGVFFHVVYKFRWEMENRYEIASNLLKMAAIVLPQSKTF